MSSGGVVGKGKAWDSTAGGHSVSHTAAAVQGASLRTLPLLAPLSLMLLANPLATLLAGAPSLELLGETAARALGGESEGLRRSPRTTPASGRRSSPKPAPAAKPTAAGRPSTSRSPGPISVAARAAGAGSSGATSTSAALGQAAKASAHPAASPSWAGQLAGSKLGGLSDEWVSAEGKDALPDPQPDSGMGKLLDRISAAALAAGARRDSGARRASHTPPEPSADNFPGLVSEQETGVGLSAGDAAVAKSKAYAAKAMGRAEGSVGALGELVGRWQQSEQLPELAPMSASRSPFAPLASAGTTGFTETGRSPDGAADEVSLDQVQQALDELLRREAEQHGLEGGLV
jgi:hypothetical protein